MSRCVTINVTHLFVSRYYTHGVNNYRDEHAISYFSVWWFYIHVESGGETGSIQNPKE